MVLHNYDHERILPDVRGNGFCDISDGDALMLRSRFAEWRVGSGFKSPN